MIRGASKLFVSLSPHLPVLSARHLSRFSRFFLARVSACQDQRFSVNSLARLGSSIRVSEQFHTQTDIGDVYGGSNRASPASSRVSHPWPEWSKLVENLRSGGYFGRERALALPDDDDGFSMVEDLPEEFLSAANACLLFARDRPELLSALPRKDVEVLVENGSAFLFKNGMNSTRRLRSFLESNGSFVVEVNKAHTVDVMRFLLSYACNPFLASDQTNLNNKELVETSVRNLLNELGHMSGMIIRETVPSGPASRQFPESHFQSSRPFGQNIEMKRGDWICPKCSFMNFARNVKCLECNEARPKRQLTGGEWECPQCDFFNYGRNAVCLRCDCKRPEESLFGSAGSQSGLAYSGTSNGTNSNISDIGTRLAANDEKAERWFRKVSQMDVSDMNSAVADEDFPEIMPLRKGVNQFVVSTRKTPLERRLERAQYRQNLGNDNSPGVANDFQAGNSGETTHDKVSVTSINQCLDRILWRTSAVPEINNSVRAKTYESATGTEQRFTSSQYSQNTGNQNSAPGYVPPVPSSANMFTKPQNPSTEAASGSSIPVSTKEGVFLLGASRGSITDASHDDLPIPKPENSSKREGEPAEKSDRWFKKDQFSAPPQTKRRLEQSNSSNFVPFVPFPPDYFAKKDKQPESGVQAQSTSETSAPEKHPDLSKPKLLSYGTEKVSAFNDFENQRSNKDQWTAHSSVDSRKMDSACGVSMVNSAHQPNNLPTNAGEGLGSRSSGKENSTGNSTQQFQRKSLEGSLVKEPDPLDMSEEAKAERWFRRVAQIKDISELSQIPDEDFPSIMPMRKGVNRFVVSKRKTPLERRLTSQQHRRSLPVVSSDPNDKKDPSS